MKRKSRQACDSGSFGTPSFWPNPSLYIAMNKAMRGRLFREEMMEDMNRLAVIAETRNLKLRSAMPDTRRPFINGVRQVMPDRLAEQFPGARGRRLDE